MSSCYIEHILNSECFGSCCTIIAREGYFSSSTWWCSCYSMYWPVSVTSHFLSLSLSHPQDLPRFQELIFADFSRFILVENIFEEVVLQSVTKDIMMGRPSFTLPPVLCCRPTSPGSSVIARPPVLQYITQISKSSSSSSRTFHDWNLLVMPKKGLIRFGS